MKILEWNDYIELCNDLYNQLKFKTYDGLISIGRRGTIAGAILASKLGTRIYPVFVIHRGQGDDKTTDIVRLDIAPTLPEGRYLLVDDQCYTGETFDLLKKALPKQSFETASLIYRETQYQPDYAVDSIDEEIMFPYDL
jgi:hypoxanthine phosphoribosyltransferase